MKINMKLVIQRVKYAKVEVEEKITGEIEKGFLILVGVEQNDTKEQADWLANKVCNLRIFEDENEKMNLSLKDVNGKILIISQFTLYADCNKGNRPSFIQAAEPKKAEKLYEYFKQKCRNLGIKVEAGIFGAHMKVELLNDGPVTIILEK